MFKIFFATAMTVSMMISGQARAQNDNTPVLMEIPIQAVHVPNGFDSNDNVQIVFESYLPNPCYKVGPHKVQVDKVNRIVKLEQQVYRYPGMICPQVIVPFATVVDVGLLAANTYDIQDATSGQTLGRMGVRQSNNLGPDDYFYAPVADARYDLTKRTVTLEGVFTNSCLSFADVKVYLDPKDVVVVLPILKPWQSSPACKAGKFPFSVTAKLPAMTAGRYLLHVRSMNGRSINKIFDIY